VSLLIRELEHTESRVLGALRCIDASGGMTITAPLQVRVAGARMQRNRSGLYVIVRADALAAHESAFDAPPATPPPGAVALTATILDPAGRYLARTATLALPREPRPTHSAQVDSLFRPIEVAMFPASDASVGANWSVLRVSVRETASSDLLGGALLLVTSGADTLGRGITDGRGEALVAVPGVPVTTWSEDPAAVVVSEIAAQLEVIFDPAAGRRVPLADLRAGRITQSPVLIDPDALESRRAALPHASLAVQLAAGREQSISFPLALP
jgi:hypothetical protein